jgi:type IV secretion system protein VirD4
MEQETFLAFIREIYSGVMVVLHAFLDVIRQAYFAMPADWPAWAKVSFIFFGLVGAGYVLFALLDGGLKFPLRILRKIWLLMRSPFGGSKFARWRDLKRAGLLRKGELFLGLYRGLFRKKDLYHSGEGHFLTIAAPGGGKTTAALVPAVLECRKGSLVITDPKGEITAMTRRHRSKVSRVVYLNPYHADFTAHTGIDYEDTGFNPFDMIDNDANTRANADKFARLLCVTDRKDSNSYFQDEGAELLSLFITWMVKYEPPENRNLTYLYSLVRSTPEQVFEFIDYMGDPVLIDDANRFRDMFEHAPQQWAGVVSKAQLATKRYVPTSPLSEHVCKSGFDPRILKSKNVTVYILLPSEHIDTGTPWLNMVIGLLGHAVGKAGKARLVTFLLDELPALGYLPDLRTQMRQYRTSGLRMWLFTQTAAALYDSDMYGEAGWKDIVGLCKTKQYFNIVEPNLAEDISKQCGEKTRINRQFQESSDGLGISTVGVPLIRPEEILKMKAGKQLILRGDMPPIQARLVPFFTRRKWRKRTDKNPYRE